MTNYTKKLGTAIATVALLANSFSGVALAGTTITLSGNGASSDNGAIVNNTQSTSVSQNNIANFDNHVSGSANTGDNTASKNTGGAVSVKTGDANVNNTLSNAANQNYANTSCGCDQGDTLVKIAGNGADSNNTANLNNSTSVGVSQGNNADFDNNISGHANTGDNEANKNTGGPVEVTTGDASVNNSVSNWANANSAVVGGGSGNGGSVSLMITGNGANSDNGIVVNDGSSVSVGQNNNAEFDNHVGGSANTGDNEANKNTGGPVEVTTGDASVNNSVENMANFNWADLNCGCLVGDGGLTVSVDGNGNKSDNDVNGNFSTAQALAQGNNADFDNSLRNLKATTGDNEANKNTGLHTDPSVTTGDASTGADVSNTANLNGLGGTQPTWPTWNLGGSHLTLSFDLNALLLALGL